MKRHLFEKSLFGSALSVVLVSTLLSTPIRASESNLPDPSEITQSGNSEVQDPKLIEEINSEIEAGSGSSQAPELNLNLKPNALPESEPMETPGVAGENTVSTDPITEEIRLIVTFENQTSAETKTEIFDSLDNASLSEVSGITSSTSVIVADGNEAITISELLSEPLVKSVSVDELNQFARTPTDLHANQWHLKPWGTSKGIDAELAWDISTGSSDVAVAVLDTGKVNHPDLVGKWLLGWDFLQGDNDPTDPGRTPGDDRSSGWHGTAIAGVIAATTNNGTTGVAGINWNSKILPVRIGSGDGAYDSDLIKGIRWAAGLSVTGAPVNANPAKVINLSWGKEAPCSAEIQQAINAARAVGSIVVAAAGNGDEYGPQDTNDISPANCQNVLSVSASDQLGERVSWAGYGSAVDVLAPGISIYTTTCSGTDTCGSYIEDYVSGTSFSAPIVAAVASLMLSVDPSLSPAELELLITSNTKPREDDSDFYCSYYGCGTGIVNAQLALQASLDAIVGLKLLGSGVSKVTLPLTDSYQDKVSLEFITNSGDTCFITILDSLGNDTLALNQEVIPEPRSSASYKGAATITPTSIPAGSYTIRVTQGSTVADRALVINSGVLSTLTISKSATSVFPYKDGYRDSAVITVVGKDSQGNVIPVVGTVKLNNVSVNLTYAKNTAIWNWARVPKGNREIIASAKGPAGAGKTAKTTIVIAPSVATKVTIATNLSTVFPVKDNYLDSVRMTYGVTSNTGKKVPGTGTIKIYQGTTVKSANEINSWTFKQTNLNSQSTGATTWNGLNKRKVVPGKYTIVVTFKSSDSGKNVKATRTINISDKKRVLKTKKGPWYTARYAFDDCVGDSLGDCYNWNSTESPNYSGIMVEAYGTIGMQSSLPFPVSSSAVASWRVHVYGSSSNPGNYIVYPCESDEFVYSCTTSDPGSMYFTGSGFTDYTWATPYSALGRSDGYANWMISTSSYSDFYAYQYQIEVRYWALE